MRSLSRAVRREVQRRSRILGLVPLTCAMLPTPFGQALTSLSGILTDPSGAVIPGAAVILESIEKGTGRQTAADQSGRYLFVQVQPDTYRPTAQAPSLKGVVINDVQLLVNTPATINIAFEKIGTAAESVAVSAIAAQVNITDATVGNVIASAASTHLPFYAREAVQLLSLQPGVTSGGQVNVGLGLSRSSGAERPPFYTDKQDLLYYLDRRVRRYPVGTKGDWEKRRRHIVANMELVMGPLPRINHKLPLRIEVLKEVRTEDYTWRRITYASERGDRVYAYLYFPNGLKRDRRTPAIVSLHSTTYPLYIPRSEPTAVSKPNDTGDTQYAQELAERGYVVIAPDYLFLSPEYKTNPYVLGYVSGTLKGIVNHIRALEVLASLPEVDPSASAPLAFHSAVTTLCSWPCSSRASAPS